MSDRRGPDHRNRGLRLLVCLPLAILLVWLAWQIVLNASVRDLATGGSAQADAADPIPAALVRSAETQILEAGAKVDWAEVRRKARIALRGDPLESRALLLLALAAEAEGDDDQASALMGLAGGRSLRNPRVHLWLFDRRLKEREFAAALRHADVILRVHPRLGPTLLPPLMAVASAPDGRAPFVEMLERGPPWRSWFLREFSRHAADPSDASPIYAALQSGSHPLSHAELRPHLDSLIGSGRFEQALLVWLASLPPKEASGLSYVFNGDFERPITNLPFEWVISDVPGAVIDVADSPIGEGKALRIQFARARIPFHHVAKLVMLPPGSYQISGRVSAVDLHTARGLRWRLACAEGTQEVLASTALITGTTTADIIGDFIVPAAGCRAQWLRLELAARISLEQDVDGGTVWYDSLQIRRTGAPSRS